MCRQADDAYNVRETKDAPSGSMMAVLHAHLHGAWLRARRIESLAGQEDRLSRERPVWRKRDFPVTAMVSLHLMDLTSTKSCRRTS